MTETLTSEQIANLNGADLVRAWCAYGLGWTEWTKRQAGSEAIYPRYVILPDGSAQLYVSPQTMRPFDPLRDYNHAMQVAADIQARGYHMELRSPFEVAQVGKIEPGLAFCGFTPNVHAERLALPWFIAQAKDGRVALLRAAVMVACQLAQPNFDIGDTP